MSGRVVAEYEKLGAEGGKILGRKITEVITVNGARVHLEDGSWVLVRASSNKPELVVVVESTQSEDDMRRLFREEVKPRLARHPEVGAYNQEDLRSHVVRCRPNPIRKVFNSNVLATSAVSSNSSRSISDRQNS
jgi:hypothetical protein